MIDLEQRDEARGTAAVRDAGAVVILAAKQVFLSTEEAGELTGVSRDSIIRWIDTGAIMVGTHRRTQLGAFGTCRRPLAQQWRRQRRPGR